MGNVFRSKKHDQPPLTSHHQRPTHQPSNPNAVINEQDRAILQLKVQKDRLHKYTQQIQLVIAREIQMAKELLKQEKKANALLALKRKKYQENLLSQTESQMLNLEELVHSIQFASMQKEVFEAIQHGNNVLAKLNTETSLEAVEQLMEDTREAVEYQQQVAKLMGAELNEEDEADIEKTIAGWEEEVLAVEIEQLPAVTNHEAPVTTAPTSSTTKTSQKPFKTKATEKEIVLA